MPLKLYYAPGACSFVPHAMLEASGVPFETVAVKLHKNEQKSPQYLALNPHGQVPTLVDGAEVITQIGAIALYLDERFPQCGFLPREPAARAHAFETLMWMNNTAHPTFTHFFRPGNFAGGEPAHADIKAFNAKLFDARLREIEAMVAALPGKGRAFLSGENFGPVDAYAVTLLRWGGYVGLDPENYPAYWSHVQRVVQLPPVARAFEREGVKLNVYQSA